MSYLFAAYAAMWIALFWYIWNLSSQQKKLDEEMNTLKKLLDQSQKK